MRCQVARPVRRAGRGNGSGAIPTPPRSDPYVIGKGNLTAIGTLVERATGYTMLLHLPDGYNPSRSATPSPPRSRHCRTRCGVR